MTFVKGQRNAGRPRKQPGRSVPGVFDADDAPEVELDAPRALELGKIADRRERAEQLTTLLRDLDAKGAERVAAARMLEAMEQRSEQTDVEVGAPAPTTRAEQVVRLVRVLACAGPTIRAEAITIVGRRSEKGIEAVRQFTNILAEPVVYATQAVSPVTGAVETISNAKPTSETSAANDNDV